MSKTLTRQRVNSLLRAAARCRVVVVGDVMLDEFLWGNVRRISPEAPVPVVEFERESFMPGGAANVARNLTALGAGVELFGLVGKDEGAKQLRSLLKAEAVGSGGLKAVSDRMTTRKTRVVAHQQQVVRIDRESGQAGDGRVARRLLAAVDKAIEGADAVIVGDYNKGVVTQELLEGLRGLCRPRGIWLSLDPKPAHRLEVSGMSLITPNRAELFEMAGKADDTRHANPLRDKNLLAVVKAVQAAYQPALLLVTLSEQGMLLAQRGARPVVIPTVAREVYDVSGAGDTVIASFTAAIAAGASPLEAAVFSNHAAGVVVGKVGTATVAPKELAASFA
ncbi:MAG: D-glycero-beta-D-manno-heptose-7-phosphate kinase [Verrucomicrobiales bacterium]|nr:D-glycero-beta-D-manno-heptose-7-phosphate kinase [Verrucomicrobiales bacterium]|tara:strand:- start:9696 stop:10703 length:1008 start_codon:yes stop_codon:yes gene_type:complete